jgi:hypothetical protein
MTDTSTGRTAWSLLNRIPGYSGYRDKENRRDIDRAVRDRLVADLTSRAERAERLAQQLAEQRQIQSVSNVNHVVQAIRSFSDRVNTASYGYGGLFGQRDVDAGALDQIRLFDESMFAGLDQIDGGLSDLESAVSAAGDIATAAKSITDAVASLNERWDTRSRVVETGTPANPAQMTPVLSVLQTPAELAESKAPAPTYDLHDRDAIAVQGDNYVVDARIDIESANGVFRIFRVDVAPDKWLLAPKKRGDMLALLTMTKDAYATVPKPTIGGDEYAIESSGTGSGDVVGAGGQSERRPLAYTLLRGVADTKQRAVVLQWGGEQQVLVGSDIHPDDIEIFGKPH